MAQLTYAGFRRRFGLVATADLDRTVWRDIVEVAGARCRQFWRRRYCAEANYTLLYEATRARKVRVAWMQPP